MSKSDIYLLARLPELSEKEKHQQIQAALADVDAGRTLSHEEIISWARSLSKFGHHSNGTE